eukprot:GHVQ01014799.1.p1 GENE.GHVQ01014799.1~~GHVQ01014799.1.p1  ORF type:complete len:106 (+),score=22.28 GHVQ01014799.1:308-625(+)
MVEHTCKTHHKNEHERHDPRHENGQAYGTNARKGGAGKYNWGDSGNADGGAAVVDDPKDPMHDSDTEAVRAKAKNTPHTTSPGSSSTPANSTPTGPTEQTDTPKE